MGRAGYEPKPLDDDSLLVVLVQKISTSERRAASPFCQE